MDTVNSAEAASSQGHEEPDHPTLAQAAESNDPADSTRQEAGAQEGAKGYVRDQKETFSEHDKHPASSEHATLSQPEPATAPTDLLHVQSTLGIQPASSETDDAVEGDGASASTALDPAQELQRLREAVKRARGNAKDAGLSCDSEVKLPKSFGEDERMLDGGEEVELKKEEEEEAKLDFDNVAESVEHPSTNEAQAEVKADPDGRDMLNRALEALGEQPVPNGIKAEVSSSDDDDSSDESSSSGDSESSSDESDSDSDSSSSSSSSSTLAGDSKTNKKRGNAVKPRAIKREAEYDVDDDDEGGGASGGVLASQNEILAPDIPKPPFDIVPDELELRPLGKVHSIVDSVVAIAQDVGAGRRIAAGNGSGAALPRPVDSTGRVGEGEGEYSVLDTGSLLVFEDRKVLGLVFEAFGSVLSPLYALRFASASDISALGVQIGQKVLYVPAHSTYVLTRQLRMASGKGSDASNVYDEEVGEDEMEFSDDEAEMEHRRRLKEERKGKGKGRAREEDGAAGSGGWNGDGREAKRGKGARGRGRGGAFGASHGARGGRAPAPLPQRPTWDPDAPTQTAGEAAAAMAMGRSKPLPYDEDGAGPIASSTTHAPQPLPSRPATSTPALGKAGLPARPGLPTKPSAASAPTAPQPRPPHTLRPPPQPQQQAGPSMTPTSVSSYGYSPPSAQPQAQPLQPQAPQAYGGYGYAAQAPSGTPAAPPPGAHINPLFASQWGYPGPHHHQQHQHQQGYAQPYAQPQAWAQPYPAAPQQQPHPAYAPHAQHQQQSYAQQSAYAAGASYLGEAPPQGYLGPPAIQGPGTSYDPSQPATGMPGPSSASQQQQQPPPPPQY